LFNIESVFGSLRPERMDSHASTPYYVVVGMEVSLLVPDRAPQCRDALVVAAGVGADPAVGDMPT
jgi:hypothetical protein